MKIPAAPSIIRSPSSTMPVVPKDVPPAGAQPAAPVGPDISKVQEIMKDEMAKVVEKAIEATPPGPQGGMPYAKRRIMAEVNRVFQPIRSEWFSDVVAQGQWEPVAAYRFVFRSKRLEDAFNRRQLGVLDKAFNDVGARDSNVTINWVGEARADLLLSQRGKDGQVVPNNTVFHTADKKSIIKLAAQVAQTIGKMVSGWYTVLGQLGHDKKSPFPGKGSGRVEMVATDKEVSLTAVNDYGNFNGMLDRSVQPQTLINAAAQACQKRVDELTKGNPDPAKGLMGQPSGPMPGAQPSKANPIGSLAQPQPAQTAQQVTMRNLAVQPYVLSNQDKQSIGELAKQMGMVQRRIMKFEAALEQSLG